MNHYKLILLLFIPLFIGIGCKSKKNGVNSDKLKKKSAKYVFDKVNKYHLDAEWFSAKASIKFTQNGRTDKATAYIKMKKDSVIWVSIKKFGFEGARMMITLDSVFLMDRRKKKYTARPFDHVRDMTGLSSTGDNLTDFRNLYDLVLGNIILKSDNKYASDIVDKQYHLSSNADELSPEYWINGDNFTLHQLKVNQNQANRNASCIYSDYKSLTNNSIFSYIRNLNLFTPEFGEIDLELNFSKIKFNEATSTPFSIPKSYEKI